MKIAWMFILLCIGVFASVLSTYFLCRIDDEVSNPSVDNWGWKAYRRSPVLDSCLELPQRRFVDRNSRVFKLSEGENQSPVRRPAQMSRVLRAGNSRRAHEISAQSSDHEIPVKESGDHKSRVLSEAGAGAWPVQEAMIEQGTHRENQDTGLEQTTDVTLSEKQENENEKQSHQTTVEIDQVKHQFTDDKQSGYTTVLNARVRHLRDQLIRAKLYLGIGATRSNLTFTRELRNRMKDVQKLLNDDVTEDSQLPKNADEKMKAMDQTLSKGKQSQDDCPAVIKKLRAMVHSTEERLRAQQKYTMFLSQVAAKTLPKGLHCLPLRLSTEYFSLDLSQQKFPNQEKLEDPKLYHYALFSDNILAAAVVVNSTVLNAKHPVNHVFHIVTDRLNFAAMRMWFLANPPGKATIQVQNIEEFTWLNASYSPVLKQLKSQSMIDYYFRMSTDPDPNLKYHNPKYLSILNHLRFYLPEIFPKLDKVVFLDEDIVVQKDLSGLWEIDLEGKINGAVETCGETFHRFDKYLNFSNPLIADNFDPHACGWAYGMNVFDLAEWRNQKITEVYHYWQNLNHDRLLWNLGSLPPGLITFWNRTLPLDRSWHALGLGYNPNLNQEDLERAAVIHYNGNMKPWLEIGLPKYRNYWAKYVNYDQRFLQDCNVSP